MEQSRIATEPDWAAARADYEAGELSRNEISRKHRIRRVALDRRIRSHHWGEPDAELSDRQTIIQVLYAVIERHARHLEGTDLTGAGEKEAAVLHKLAVSLDKLITIEAKGGGARPGSRQGKDLLELRAKIARRLGELKVE